MQEHNLENEITKKFLKRNLLILNPQVGLRLCWHNFENNRLQVWQE